MNREDIFYFLGLHTSESKTIQGLMNLHATTAKEIMTPLSHIVSLEVGQTTNDLVELLSNQHYSRFPIYKDRADNIIGYVQVVDLLQIKRNSKLKTLMYQAEFVSEFLSCEQVLSQMQKKNLPMVFIINEFGSVIGLLTIEDIAEELVGIFPNGNFEKQDMMVIPDKKVNDKYVLSGSLDIDDFNSHFKLHIEKEGFETLAGYLMRNTNHIPKKNEIIKTSVGVFKVQSADKKNIKKVWFQFRS